jgi:hypothetical protein
MRTSIILIITLCSSSLISAQQLPNYFPSNDNFPNFPSNGGFSRFQQPSNTFSQYQPYSNRIPSVPQANSGYPNFPQPPSAGFANYQQQPPAIAQPQPSPAGPGLSYSWNINHAAAQSQPNRQVQNYSPQPQPLSPPSIPQSFSSSIPQPFNSQPYRPQSYSPTSIPQSFSAPSIPQYQPQYQSQYQPQYQPQPASAPAPQQNFQTTNQINPQNSQNFNPAPVHYSSIGPQLQGDYKFGYHTGDGGSFREETRLPDGTVQGAYGFIDANGKQRIVKYSAGKDGFKAEGDDVPSPAVPIGPSSAPQQYAPQQYAPQSNSIGPFNLEDGQAFKSFMQG